MIVHTHGMIQHILNYDEYTVWKTIISLTVLIKSSIIILDVCHFFKRIDSCSALFSSYSGNAFYENTSRLSNDKVVKPRLTSLTKV